jgi:hypothetical protein
MATPHVAGAVALMVTANPGMQHDEIKEVLIETAIDLGAPGMDNEFGAGRVDAYEAVLNSASPNGKINLKQTAGSCNAQLNLTVTDSDLKGTGSLSVNVKSTTEPGGETIVLNESGPNTGSFRGIVTLSPNPPASNGTIEVRHGDLVTATYIDANDGQGGLDVPKLDTANVDCRAPLISAIDVEQITNTSATITWTTDELSDSRAHYGPVPPPTSPATGNSGTTSHRVDLSNLQECTIYYFQVSSQDVLTNGTTDNNGGAYYRFETYGNFPEIGIAPCHAGQVRLDRTIYSCSGSATLTVNDLDLNTNSGAIESVTVQVTSSGDAVGEIVTLTEQSANSAQFTASLPLGSGPPVAANGILELAHDDLVAISYFDANDGAGTTRFVTDEAVADCLGATATGVRLTWLSNTRAIIDWNSSEPTSSRVEFGSSASLGSAESDSTLTTVHSIVISGFDACQRVHFTVGGTDAYGNTRRIDAGGAPFAFNTQQIPGLYFYDGFETDKSWSRGPEWQRGAPQSSGGSGGGVSDPARGFSGNQVLGLDLTGLGAFPGDYENNALSAATTPFIQCGACQNTVLIYRRQLNAGNGDLARVSILQSGRHEIWENSSGVFDSSWSEQRHNIAAIADGKPVIQVQFGIDANGSGNYSGWNVDELIVKNGALPDYQVCSGCSGGPSFRGLDAAADVDACAASGVRLNWEPATAWGTGAAGTYNIYRDTNPSFTPNAGNRIAVGIDATTFTDPNPLRSQTAYYVVRAENAESGCSGPSQGGVEESNVVRQSAIETSTRPPAASPGGSLDVDALNHTHLRLSWGATAGTAFYRVYRSESPDMSNAQVIGETSATQFEDAGAGANLKRYYYRVVSVNPCGLETN